MAVVIGLHLAGLDPFADRYGRRLGAGSFDQPRGPAFESQTIDEDDFGGSDFPGIGRRRRIDVGIGVGSHERGDVDPVAAYIFHQIAKNGETRDHRDLLFLRKSR